MNRYLTFVNSLWLDLYWLHTSAGSTLIAWLLGMKSVLVSDPRSAFLNSIDSLTISKKLLNRLRLSFSSCVRNTCHVSMAATWHLRDSTRLLSNQIFFPEPILGFRNVRLFTNLKIIPHGLRGDAQRRLDEMHDSVFDGHVSQMKSGDDRCLPGLSTDHGALHQNWNYDVFRLRSDRNPHLSNTTNIARFGENAKLTVRNMVVSFVDKTDLEAVSVFTPSGREESFVLEVRCEENFAGNDVSFNDFFCDSVVGWLNHREEESSTLAAKGGGN